ncbi:DUF2459 domain-containing protein [Altererythrobacter sp. GH1-8]|uniref:DUF2459 domain-containing protein n=1 Tax=Altererythrobacter sp. GH1-8 TaxID=3349333 RepID=UPI00374C96DE
MAAQTPVMILAKRLILWPFAALLAALVLFLLTAWIGSSIPRNADWVEPQDGIEIMVETNGVHTALVLPLVNVHKDWSTVFPARDLREPMQPYTHVSISWGEKEVFLNTETWADLKPSVAIGAIYDGEPLLHIAHYIRPQPSANHRPLTMTEEEYRKLVAAIEPYVLPPESREIYPGYSWFDVFYDASGNYSARRTCNQWTSDMLAKAGIRTGWWTPLEGGVMKWVEPLQDSD